MPVKQSYTQSLLILISTVFFVFFSISAFSSVNYKFTDTDGKVYSPKDLKNKWVIVNYWASWCDSCIDEIPELNKFHSHNKDKNILILGVNYDHLPPPHLNNTINSLGIKFPVLQEDPGKYLRLGIVSVLPTTFVINPNGDIVKKVIGANTEQSLLKIVHNQMLAKKLQDSSYIKTEKV